MVKKIVASILSTVLIISTVGCTSEKVNEETPQVVEERSMELPGTWSVDYTRDEVAELHNEILRRVEDVVLGYGLQEEYDIKEEIREENGVSINDNRIYLDIENPEGNKLESMYYGFKQHGSDLASGELSMKLGFNLDKQTIQEAGKFDFKETSLASFSEAFTNVTDRDYTDINNIIYSMVLGETSDPIENNLDGIKETITITDDFLLYKLETKQYNFK